jgi:hypothetical protein
MGGASFPLYLYPPTPPPINDPYKGTMPQVSENFFGEKLENLGCRTNYYSLGNTEPLNLLCGRRPQSPLAKFTVSNG